MKQIQLKIDANKIIDLTITDSWSELNINQVLYIANFWQAWQLMLKNNQSMRYARAKLFMVLIKNKTAKELKQIFTILSTIDFETLEINLLSYTDFVFQNIELTNNIIPTLKIGWFKKLYGPSDKLSNITINEFSFALNYYNLYNKFEKDEHLDLLIACLYRRPKKNWEESGDIRTDFNTYTADKYLPQIKILNYAHKQAVYLYFHSCIELFSKLFPYVFSKAEAGTSNSKQTFLDVILKIAGGKFGSYNETKSEKAIIILRDLNTILQENAKTKK